MSGTVNLKADSKKAEYLALFLVTTADDECFPKKRKAIVYF